MRRIFILAAACWTAVVPGPGQALPHDPADRLSRLLERSRDAMGDATRLRALGGLTVEAAGPR